MRFSLISAAALVSLVLLSPAVARADAAEDLAVGRTALAAGELDKALPLLVSAAQALPQSVEAQLALAECYLKLGQAENALKSYRAVLKLSPEHALAKRLVAGLTGQTTTAEQQQAWAQSLVEAQAYDQAIEVIKRIVDLPLDPAQRGKARVLLAEVYLWNGATGPALVESLRLAEEGAGEAAGPMRVVAALALLSHPKSNVERAGKLLDQAGDVPAPWAARRELGRLLIQLEDPTAVAIVSSRLAGPMAAVPDGAFRAAVLDRLSKTLLTAAHARIGRGDDTGAFAIAWPMVSTAPPPGPDAILKPIEVAGGWRTGGRDSAAAAWSASRILADTAILEFNRDGANATLLGYWLAAEALRAESGDEAVGYSLALAAELARLSRPLAERRPGTPFSQADQLQRAMLIRLSGQVTNEQQRQQLVDQVTGQIERYRHADDLDTGLAQFVTLRAPLAGEAAAGGLVIDWAGGLGTLTPGAADQRLNEHVAQAYATLGQKAFNEEAATLVADANKELNKFDRAALLISGRTAALYPAENNPRARGTAIIERYAAIAQWGAAAEGATAFHGALPGNAGRWGAIHLAIRQVAHAEDKLLATGRRLPNELDPQVKKALADTAAILADAPTEANRRAAISVAGPLVTRYAGLDRGDLAEAVLAAVAGAGNAPLADWAIWTRVNLLESQASRSLATAAAQFNGGEKLPLDERHKASLALIDELLTKHPTSDYIGPAVERVIQISLAYQNHRSFDTARGVLADFVKAHANLAAADRVDFQIVQVELARARRAFDERPDKFRAPTELSPEYAAAIDAIAAFLAARPGSPFAPSAEENLFGVAQHYGQAQAWPVVRDVLARFAKALPDYRRPAYLRFLEAVTYLGELDGNYAQSLMQPAPKPQARPGVVGDVSALAMGRLDSFKDADLLHGLTDDTRRRMEEAEKIAVSGPVARTPAADPSASVAAIPQPVSPSEAHFFRSFGGGGSGEPNQTALALIRQSQQRQFQQIAQLEGQGRGERQPHAEAGQQAESAGVALPGGSVLTEAEMKRQDEAAEKAYAILIELVRAAPESEFIVAENARAQILWLFGFFEGQMRADRAIALIERYLADRPNDPARVALAYQAITDRLAWAGQPRSGERVGQAWLDARHELFENARREIDKFIAAYADKKSWAQQARMLVVESFEQEAVMAASVSAVRAGGLLVRAAEALLALLRAVPDHPQAASFPLRLSQTADRLIGLGQQDRAIYVLTQIPIRFPTDPLANQAVLHIADSYAANLGNPIRAVETYQEYLSLTGDEEGVRNHVFSIAQQLAGKLRYLEALHVYGVFVDSFPTDPRAPQALQAMGQVHQSNEAWREGIRTYERILDEYPRAPLVPAVKLAVAECQINLSEWRTARRLYEEYLEQYPGDGQVEMARARLTVLKNLERYQTLLADKEVQRNKDDAQFQIGRIVLEQLQNPVKAIAEFRKVATDHLKSDLADDAQLEIGEALLSMGRLDDARRELLEIPVKYPNSPLADDALFLVAQSYERQAQQLAAVTAEKAWAERYEFNQRGAYARFNEQVAEQFRMQAERRDILKKAGKTQELALDEAASASIVNTLAAGNIAQSSRQAELQAETESALQVANRQDRINEAFREAVAAYNRAATDYPLGDKTDDSLLRIAQILETQLKDRAVAMETYQKIVKLFPGTPVAEDAAWKVAQFYEQEAKYTAAAAAYRDFIRNYPASNRVAEAQFALAEVLEQLGQWVDAMDAYETFRQKFTGHPKAQLAMDQINWIKAYRK